MIYIEIKTSRFHRNGVFLKWNFAQHNKQKEMLL